jgi:hypothetical protein
MQDDVSHPDDTLVVDFMQAMVPRSAVANAVKNLEAQPQAGVDSIVADAEAENWGSIREINPFSLSLKDPKGYRDLTDPMTRQLIIKVAEKISDHRMVVPLRVYVENGRVFVWDGLIRILAIMHAMNVLNVSFPDVRVQLIPHPLRRVSDEPLV